MTIRLLFWILMVLWFIFGFIPAPASAPGAPAPLYFRYGGTLLLFILLAILGWKVFGPALHS